MNEQLQVCGHCESFLRSAEEKSLGRCKRLPSTIFVEEKLHLDFSRKVKFKNLKVNSSDSCACWEPRKEQE